MPAGRGGPRRFAAACSKEFAPGYASADRLATLKPIKPHAELEQLPRLGLVAVPSSRRLSHHDSVEPRLVTTLPVELGSKGVLPLRTQAETPALVSTAVVLRPGDEGQRRQLKLTHGLFAAFGVGAARSVLYLMTASALSLSTPTMTECSA